MKLRKLILFCAILYSSSPFVAADKTATEKEIEDIRNEMKMLVEKYENKIIELEQRLQAVENTSEENTENNDALAIEVSQQGNQQAANTYNPGLGVILNGQFQTTDSSVEYSIPGFALGEESGPASDGFELGESEMNLTANVDDKFYASVTLAFGDEVEVEEAYLQTIALPNGISIKAGRFFSNIGYLASRHKHTDNFADRPIAYTAFLGGQYGDDGIQLTWIAPTDIYWESGFELYRGENFPASGAADDGTGVWTIFSHIGDDINDDHSWRLGLSYLDATVEDRTSGLNESFTGDSNLWIADFVWKWAPNGNPAINNAIIQAEYLRRSEHGIFNSNANLNNQYDADQDGWYIEGIYQFIPRWRAGLRYSNLTSDNLSGDFFGSTLDNFAHDPERTSLMIDWSNSEFSRFRLQYNLDQSQPTSAHTWMLQYIAAFGAHGGHSF